MELNEVKEKLSDDKEEQLENLITRQVEVINEVVETCQEMAELETIVTGVDVGELRHRRTLMAANIMLEMAANEDVQVAAELAKALARKMEDDAHQEVATKLNSALQKGLEEEFGDEDIDVQIGQVEGVAVDDISDLEDAIEDKINGDSSGS